MTKNELSQLYWLNREIERDRKKLLELEQAASSGTAKLTGMPPIGGVGRTVEVYGILLAEQQELIDAKTRQCMIEYNRLNRYIASVEDSLMRQILELRYVNGLNWTQVAMSIGGNNTADSVRKAHDRFLKQN